MLERLENSGTVFAVFHHDVCRNILLNACADEAGVLRRRFRGAFPISASRLWSFAASTSLKVLSASARLLGASSSSSSTSSSSSSRGGNAGREHKPPESDLVRRISEGELSNCGLFHSN